MFAEKAQLDEVNVLASAANWAWPEALRNLFQPRGVNLMVAEDANDFVHIIGRTRIHTTIVDMDSERSNGLATIKIIRMDYPLVPCILLTSKVDPDVLGKALRLDVFGVIDKPVKMEVLHQLLNRIFLKKYNSRLFSS
jgi:DNA-binding NtrC family response regulator